VEAIAVSVKLPLPSTATACSTFTRGAALFIGYWNKPEVNAEVFLEGGWFRTGDVAYLDEGGYLYIVDRIKELIIRAARTSDTARSRRRCWRIPPYRRRPFTRCLTSALGRKSVRPFSATVTSIWTICDDSSQGDCRKDRVVPFPPPFKETLALHGDGLRHPGASYLFESSWTKPYSDRGVRRLLERYAEAAGLAHPSRQRRDGHKRQSPSRSGATRLGVRGHLQDLGWIRRYDAASLEPGQHVAQGIGGKSRVLLSVPDAHGSRPPAGAVHADHIAPITRLPSHGNDQIVDPATG
jgi:AMP-binding enzyme